MISETTYQNESVWSGERIAAPLHLDRRTTKFTWEDGPLETTINTSKPQYTIPGLAIEEGEPSSCATPGSVALGWQREPPDSPGEWLWLCQWSCGCVMKAGVAWVPERDETPSQVDCVLPCGLSLSWEGQALRDDMGIDEVVAWAKIKLPPREWCEV